MVEVRMSAGEDGFYTTWWLLMKEIYARVSVLVLGVKNLKTPLGLPAKELATLLQLQWV
jgi:hypothetical protein